MPTFDATNTECLIFTYKDGLLSAIAHDLKLKVSQLQLQINEGHQIEAKFTANSLRVVSAMQAGTESPGALSDSDKKKIEHTIIDEVLHSARFSEIKFVSTSVKATGESYQIEGQLSLHGQTRGVAFITKREGERYTAELKLHQPDFGIKPYSAMLGTLKIKPDITLQISVPVW
jgi:polyisoprenoid-binding protein YceI